jgi:PKHD-type hydroxylase
MDSEDSDTIMTALETEKPSPSPLQSPVFAFGLQPLPEYSDTCWVDAFTREEVTRILATAEALPIEDASVGNEPRVDPDVRRSRVRWLPFNAETAWIYRTIGDIVWSVNKVRFHFDLHGFHEGLQIAEYGPGSFFNWHKDHGPGVHSVRKLSVTVQLSDEDDYEGGVMEFLHGPAMETARRKIGSMIIFPAFVMHRVTEVTSGVRRSGVAWISGPPYR